MKILFVDDEINIIQGLKRMLYPFRKEWIMSFANSGEEALELLTIEKFDVVVSDMRMPKIDGLHLFTTIKELYPNIVRIILSGYTEKESILNLPNVAHQFLSKPCDANTLKESIERISKLRNFVNNEKILNLISGISTIPTLPGIYVKLQKEINSSTASVKGVGEIISKDVAMTTKILQLVNSAFFGVSQKITDPVYAVSFLGFETIKSLAMYVKIFSSLNFNDYNKFFAERVFQHSYKVGELARKIIRSEVYEKSVLDSTFLGGLVHDIGKLILLQTQDYTEKINQSMNTDKLSYIDAEYKLFDTSHSEVGAYLLGLWGLPVPILEIAAFHHLPLKADDVEVSPMSAVHLANILANQEKFDPYLLRDLYPDNKLVKNICKNFENGDFRNEQ
ncbi:MAG: response regulator [Ignavibacteriaceae bacterium]|nr:response regulator [Ignavibacteriaceae bacterium]